jgi:hypothetical protein
MTGGEWLSQNKVRPGAYINFKAVPRPGMTAGSRGIAAIPLALSWGPEDVLIDVYSDELLDGRSLSKVGFSAFDEESKLLAGMLNYCYRAKVFRLDKGGVQAAADIGPLTATAKYAGTFGNGITVSIVEEGALFTVSTFASGKLQDSQKVADETEVVDNAFLSFSVNASGELFGANAGVMLTGGSNGTVQETNAYPSFFGLLSMARWQVMAAPTSTESVITATVTFIRNQRTDEGKYVQAVLPEYGALDYEGIISNANGAMIDGIVYSNVEMTAVIAGMAAGASITASNTGRVVSGATQIIGELDNAGIIEALGAGRLVLSANQNGDVKVEQDINSLHTFSQDKPYAFSKNRVIRTLDEIGTTVKHTWETMYQGKVNNDANGRASFKSDILSYLGELNRLGAIQEFAGAEDVWVAPGANLDAVICDLWVKPVDSMEKLYMTCYVRA